MKLDELKVFINESIKDAVPTMVKEAVESAVATNLAAAVEGSDIGKKQKELQDQLTEANKQLKEKSKGFGPQAPRERMKGEAIGACVRAIKRSGRDYDMMIRSLKKDGHNDIAELYEDSRKDLEDQAKAMTAGDPETGGILIPLPVSGEIIDLLRAKVLIRKMNPITLPMPSGNFRIPKKTEGTSSYYVGESESPPTSRVKHGSVLLSFKKQVTVVPTSNDLMRYSSPGADQIIRNDIVDETAVRQDQAFLRDPGSDATPKGLRFWAAPDNVVSAAGSTGGDANLAGMTSTLSALILKLLEDNIPMSNVHWLFSPRTMMNLSIVRIPNGPYAFREEMGRGTLWGYPFLVSTTVPNTLTVGANSDTSEIYLVDANEIIIGDSQRLMIDASGEAAYEENGTVKAAFTRDETVIRAISEHDMIVRRESAVAVATNVRWGV